LQGSISPVRQPWIKQRFYAEAHWIQDIPPLATSMTLQQPMTVAVENAEAVVPIVVSGATCRPSVSTARHSGQWVEQVGHERNRTSAARLSRPVGLLPITF
jgi:hypothetical protein